MDIDSIPRDLKEKIWTYLDDREYYRLRIVKKSWKREMENPKSKILRERIENGKKESERFDDKKHFYKNFTFTSIAISLGTHFVGIELCYGRVTRFMHISAFVVHVIIIVKKREIISLSVTKNFVCSFYFIFFFLLHWPLLFWHC